MIVLFFRRWCRSQHRSAAAESSLHVRGNAYIVNMLSFIGAALLHCDEVLHNLIAGGLELFTRLPACQHIVTESLFIILCRILKLSAEYCD